MATFSMTVKNKPVKTETPYILSDDNNECFQTMVIKVIVPVGQSRYVEVINTGAGTTPATYDKAETITTTTDYTLDIQGFINSDPAANTSYGEVVIKVSLTNTDPIFYFKKITRTHSNVVC